MAMIDKGNAARPRRYRKQHRRSEYAPSAEALKIIEKRIAAGFDTCMAGVIDRLIIAGDLIVYR